MFHCMKGRVACEITTCDELIGTELVFNNVLTSLEPDEIVALLSCLVGVDCCNFTFSFLIIWADL